MMQLANHSVFCLNTLSVIRQKVTKDSGRSLFGKDNRYSAENKKYVHMMVPQQDQGLSDRINVTYKIYVRDEVQVPETPVTPTFVFRRAEILINLCHVD